MEGQKSLFPKAEQVLGPLDTYTTSLTERILSAEETITKKKAEIFYLKEELGRTAKAIRIVRDELMGGSNAKVLQPGDQGILPTAKVEAKEKPETKTARGKRIRKSAHEQLKKVARGRTDLGMAAANTNP